jgi:hypothetical protein
MAEEDGNDNDGMEWTSTGGDDFLAKSSSTSTLTSDIDIAFPMPFDVDGLLLILRMPPPPPSATRSIGKRRLRSLRVYHPPLLELSLPFVILVWME